jgi:hypothetical protein
MELKFPKLFKTNVEKMSAFRLSRIFMKTNELNHAFQDVDEKKGESRSTGIMNYQVCGGRIDASVHRCMG